jgi:predicted dithiol-disulfide oxidoreductase (DUF899 family)
MATQQQTPIHSVSFPGESDSYRTARNELLQAEIALRKQIEAVAEMRRRLPLGGAVREDYVFEEAAPTPGDSSSGHPVRMSELFSPGKDTLVVYSFMYGPEMKSACTSCTSILDSLDGTAPHVSDRLNLVVVAKSPLERIRSFAQERGWRNLRLLSSASNTYNHDYQGEDSGGKQRPSLNVFVRRDGAIHHFYNTELMFAAAEPGQNARHVDSIWPLWNLFDFSPEGRGENWYPKLSYR